MFFGEKSLSCIFRSETGERDNIFSAVHGCLFATINKEKNLSKIEEIFLRRKRKKSHRKVVFAYMFYPLEDVPSNIIITMPRLLMFLYFLEKNRDIFMLYRYSILPHFFPCKIVFGFEKGKEFPIIFPLVDFFLKEAKKDEDESGVFSFETELRIHGIKENFAFGFVTKKLHEYPRWSQKLKKTMFIYRKRKTEKKGKYLERYLDILYEFFLYRDTIGFVYIIPHFYKIIERDIKVSLHNISKECADFDLDLGKIEEMKKIINTQKIRIVLRWPTF